MQTLCETVAKAEHELRPLLTRLPPKLAVKIYSSGRKWFLRKLVEERPEQYLPPKELERTLWGLRFRSPLMNAAGMFKNGEGSQLVSAQGAGAYLAGTTTSLPRKGNEKEGIKHPFAPYPESHSASNWLGLPNDGDVLVAERLMRLRSSCPTGISVSANPDLDEDRQLEALAQGMYRYARAGVDFIELNESCPNTGHTENKKYQLRDRLAFIKEHFLDRRIGKTPVVVKFSTNTKIGQVPELMELLFELGFDGVNFGNTGTAYDLLRGLIEPADRDLFDYFTKTFGGGVSGAPLKQKSLVLAFEASRLLKAGPPKQEFHVIRTGGIDSAKDLMESDQAGASMSQWFTGYFSRFARDGHNLYKKMYEEYSRLKH